MKEGTLLLLCILLSGISKRPKRLEKGCSLFFVIGMQYTFYHYDLYNHCVTTFRAIYGWITTLHNLFLQIMSNTTVHYGNILSRCPLFFLTPPTGIGVMSGAEWWDWAFPSPDKMSGGELAAYATAFSFLIMVFLGSSIICIYSTMKSPGREWVCQES